MSKRTGQSQSAKDHAQGSQGKKTKARQKEILHSGDQEKRDDQVDAKGRDLTHGHEVGGGPPDGDHRLFEHRQQHDDAEKKSEKSRLAKDVDRHKH